jgi:hypothetical protein
LKEWHIETGLSATKFDLDAFLTAEVVSDDGRVVDTCKPISNSR